MAIEIIGGSELTTPTQAKVMMFGFAPPSWLLTKTTGVNRSALVGFMIFLGILYSFKFKVTIFSTLTLYYPETYLITIIIYWKTKRYSPIFIP
jgi:hypothetical protein